MNTSLIRLLLAVPLRRVRFAVNVAPCLRPGCIWCLCVSPSSMSPCLFIPLSFWSEATCYAYGRSFQKGGRAWFNDVAHKDKPGGSLTYEITYSIYRSQKPSETLLPPQYPFLKGNV
ncbi:uncharacterized protein B0T23DRAFT_377672 [Neurospora hispaniola]|uniref:Secreted protein n=1 Tax=Neurospora hispaniola TaxID=588809 RepID=A0AAJ0IAC2_9PEZI|nr:hypothetical protein B0T23DRAFT_377672 [Neurospora hispaniola]